MAGHFDVTQRIESDRKNTNTSSDTFEFTTKHRKPNAIQMELAAEDELARLQRKYRDMDVNTQKYQHVIRMNIQKRQNNIVMRVLSKEQQNLHSDLKVAASHNNKRLDDLLIDELKSLMREHSKFGHSIVLKKEHIQDLENQIKKIKLQLIATRLKNKESENRYQQRFKIAQGNVFQLENRLETQVNRFCCILTENVKLREEIQHLMKERELFKKDWDKFFHTLELSKKFMHDLIEQSTLVYNQREESCKKIDNSMRKARSDFLQHSENIEEIQRIMDNQGYLQTFLATKARRRIPVTVFKKDLIRQQKNEVEVKRKRDEYARILEDIKEYSDTSNLNEIEKQFLVREEYKFSVFKILNNIHEESEHIASNIQCLRNDWGDAMKLMEMRFENQTKKLDNLKICHNIASDKVDIYRKKLTNLNIKLNSMLQCISALFATIKCDPQSVQHLLGPCPRKRCKGEGTATPIATDKPQDAHPIQTIVGKSGLVMNIHNVDVFLAELERYTTEMLRNALIYQKGASTEFVTIREKLANGFKIEEIKTPCPLCLEDRQIMLCSTKVPLVLSRSALLKKLITSHSEFRLLESYLHNVSKCKMPQAALILKKQYMDE